MSFARSFACLASCLLLSACAPLLQQSTTASEDGQLPTEDELVEMAKNMPTETDIQERFRSLPGMFRQVCLAPDLAEYFRKTPCLPSMASSAHTQDASRITPEQAAAMRQAITEIQELNNETRRIMIDSGLEPYVSQAQKAQMSLDPLVKANQDALLKGEITWGEYNRRRVELSRPQPAQTPQPDETPTAPVAEPQK